MEYFKFIKKGEVVTIKIHAGIDFYTSLANLEISKMDKVQILKLKTAIDLLLEK